MLTQLFLENLLGIIRFHGIYQQHQINKHMVSIEDMEELGIRLILIYLQILLYMEKIGLLIVMIQQI